MNLDELVEEVIDSARTMHTSKAEFHIRENIKDFILQGWVPMGTYVGLDLPEGRAFEASDEYDEAGMPLWERIVSA